MATARYVLPVPAGPMANTNVFFRVASTYRFCPAGLRADGPAAGSDDRVAHHFGRLRSFVGLHHLDRAINRVGREDVSLTKQREQFFEHGRSTLSVIVGTGDRDLVASDEDVRREFALDAPKEFIALAHQVDGVRAAGDQDL